ncbi:hypothetical protein SAMN04487934_10670 [Eubacterium ruminantium]|nr:hypothetical protein SAMN04487934_10670 [Eubacterium ruminantium]
MSKKGYGKRVVSGILCFSLMTGLMPGGLRSKVYAETEMPGQGQVQEIEVTGQASALTVFDGTDTNDCVPMDGYNANIYEKSQYVIPADKLVAMDGKYIESITYYLSQVAETQWNAEFKVYLKEVDYTTMSSCDDLEGATLVYSGGLDGTQSELSIELQDNFEYHGGNLLVAIYTTTPGDFYTACFYGTNTEEVTAISGINDESMDYITDFAEFRFIPKATFAYSDEPSIIHEFTYTAEGDTVTAVCSGDDCVFKDGTTLQILAPEQAYYNGKPWAVTFSDYNRIAFTVVGDVEYYQGETKLESAPVEIGSYTAKVTVGEGEKAATAAVDFEIVGGHNFSYEADGNVITATCDEEECDITEGLTLTVNAPEDLGYDGEAKEATLSDYSEIAFPVVGEIEYYQDDIKLESAPKNIGAYTAMVTVGEGEKAVTAAIDFEIAHEHDFSYEVDGNVITATCDKEECDITEELTLTLNAPEGVFFDGDAWEATLSDYNEEAFPTVGVIEYYQGETKLESAPVNEGSYTAKVTVGEGEKAVTASVSFEITKNKKITVYDGINGDDYVPVYGFYADAYCKVQYIIPADKLAAISGSDIEAIRYYLRSPASAKKK